MDILVEGKGVPARQRRAHARPSGGTGPKLGALEHTVPAVDCEVWFWAQRWQELVWKVRLVEVLPRSPWEPWGVRQGATLGVSWP